MTTLVWTPEAVADRQEIYDCIEVNKPLAAVNLDELTSRKANLLVDYPGLGRLRRMEGMRELMIHRNYLLVYDVTKATNACLECLMQLDSGHQNDSARG